MTWACVDTLEVVFAYHVHSHSRDLTSGSSNL